MCVHMSMCLHWCAGVSTLMCPLVFLDEVCNVIKLEDLDVILSLSLPFCVILGLLPNISGPWQLKIQIPLLGKGALSSLNE